MTHRHAEDTWKCYPIGEDVCLSPFYHGEDEHLAGFFLSFDVPKVELRIPGAVNVDPHFAGERPVWQMSGTLEGGDLTLTPSIAVSGGRAAGRHGYITNGKWVPV